MNRKLFVEAMSKMLGGIVLVGALLFFPANTFSYWNAWLFMILLFIPMFLGGMILMIKNPKLLQKRLNAKEQEKEQKHVIVWSGILF